MLRIFADYMIFILLVKLLVILLRFKIKLTLTVREFSHARKQIQFSVEIVFLKIDCVTKQHDV